jgi:hypothetical protein
MRVMKGSPAASIGFMHNGYADEQKSLGQDDLCDRN